MWHHTRSMIGRRWWAGLSVMDRATGSHATLEWYPRRTGPRRHTSGTGSSRANGTRAHGTRHPRSVHWPHVHGYLPVRFYHLIPDLWKNDFTVRPDKIIMASLNMRANYVDMHESLLNQLFHALKSSEISDRPGGEASEGWLTCQV